MEKITIYPRHLEMQVYRPLLRIHALAAFVLPAFPGILGIAFSSIFLLSTLVMSAYAHDIGYVDIGKVIETMPQNKTTHAKLDKLWDKRKTELGKIEDDMTALRQQWDEYLKKDVSLNDTAREKDSEAEISELGEKYNKLVTEYLITASRYEGEIEWLDYQFRSKFYEKLNAAIARVERDKNLGNVLGCYVEGCAEQVATFSNDVTLDVIEALNLKK